MLNSTDYGIYGVLICGTGIGISIAANRHAHIRCALCHDATSARLAREHNDANVLAFGERLMGALV
ncbi:MAG: RpiB/LacA/LacB family sugar-phosphate isomerase, partial [Campylobacter sp.]